jgi:alkylated DNA repair dioxygenase AlkB
MKRKMENVPKGLQLVCDFITPDEEISLLAAIDSKEWSNDLKRRVQHYGYKYDYTRKTLGPSLGPLPSEMNFVLERVCEQKLFDIRPNQIIVNEYIDGQGISKHTDRVDLFGAQIASLSMGCECVMVFRRGSEKFEIVLPPRSLLLIQDDARFHYTHEIPPGSVKSRRVSLTMRTTL